MLDITASSRQIQALKDRLIASEKLGDFKAFVRIQALLLYFEQQQTINTVGEFMRKSDETIRLWIQEFAVSGVKSLKMSVRIGRQPKLSKAQCKEVFECLKQSPTEHGFFGGCWNSAMIQALIYKLYGVEYSAKYIPELMKRLGLSYQKAKFELNNADSAARKKWMTKIWPSIKSLASRKKAKIFFEDEASFAMWGSLAYTWAPRGVQPTVKTSGNRKSYKMFGAIEYSTGKLVYQGHQGKLNSQSYIDFLRHILRSTRGHIIMIHDGARYHTAKEVKEFLESKRERITAKRLPAYSPDYNPIEKLWRKAKRLGTHLVYFPTFESLIEQVEKTMQTLVKKADEILDLFGSYRKRKPCQ